MRISGFLPEHAVIPGLTDPVSALAKGIAFMADRFRDDRDNLREIADAMWLPVAVCNRDLSYGWVSKAYAHWVGLPADLITGRRFVDVIGPTAVNSLKPYFERVLAGECVEHEEQIFYTTPGWRWIHAVYAPTFGPERTVDGWVAMVLDTTEQTRDRLGRQESEARFRNIANGLPVLMWMGDAEGRNTFVNDTYIAFTGMSEIEIRQHWDSLVHPDDWGSYVHAYNQALVDRKKFHQLVRLRRHDGIYRWFEMIGVPRLEGDRFIGYITCGFDVTERKLSENAALEASHRKDQFLAVLGHELRNPMGAISNAVALLERTRNANRADVLALEIVRRQLGNLAKLTDDLLDLGGVTAGKIKLARSPVALDEILKQVVSSFEGAGRLKRHLVKIETSPAWINADSLRIEQVINNLLDNALKFTPNGGEIKLRVNLANHRVVLTVSDSGIGIPRDFLSRIFEPFAQARPQFGSKSGGLGLGLAITMQLIEMHGGEITVESDGFGRGATFRVSLPQGEKPSSPEADEQQHVPPERLRVIVIEDNDDNRETLRQLLEREGHQVVTAADGPQGVEVAIHFSPQLALVDLALPTWDGYEVARRLRANFGTAIRLLAMTGFGRTENKSAALAAGFDDFLVKPFEPVQLLGALKHH